MRFRAPRCALATGNAGVSIVGLDTSVPTARSSTPMAYSRP